MGAEDNDNYKDIELKKPKEVLCGLTATQLATRTAAFLIVLAAGYLWWCAASLEGEQEEQQKVIRALLMENEKLRRQIPLMKKIERKENPREMVARLTKMIESEFDEMEIILADPKLDLETAIDIHYRATAWDLAINYAFIRGNNIKHDKIRQDWVMHRMVMEKLGHLKDIPGTGDAVPHHELKALFMLRERATAISITGGNKMIQLKQVPKKKAERPADGKELRQLSMFSTDQAPHFEANPLSQWGQVAGLHRVPNGNRQAS